MDYDPVWGPGRAASVMMEGSEAGKDIIGWLVVALLVSC